MSAAGSELRRVVGRYEIYDEIASGGMGTVHFGRLLGAAGFARVVAVKSVHPQLASDPSLARMLVDEAQLASRIRHRNVVATLDVVSSTEGIFLVFEYVAGASLSGLLTAAGRAGERTPPAVASAIVLDALAGLEAAHVATDEAGRALEITHRDVSPQNVLVGTDGAALVADFGIARAANRAQSTALGAVKGKLAYLSPEQALGEPVDCRTDVFAAGIVLWETLTGERLFAAGTPAQVVGRILEGVVRPPSRLVPSLPKALDDVVLRCLARRREDRYPTAIAAARALMAAAPPAPHLLVSDWVARVARAEIEARAATLASIERRAASHASPSSTAATASTASTASTLPDVPAAGRRPREDTMTNALVRTPDAAPHAPHAGPRRPEARAPLDRGENTSTLTAAEMPAPTGAVRAGDLRPGAPPHAPHAQAYDEERFTVDGTFDAELPRLAPVAVLGAPGPDLYEARVREAQARAHDAEARARKLEERVRELEAASDLAETRQASRGPTGARRPPSVATAPNAAAAVTANATTANRSAPKWPFALAALTFVIVSALGLAIAALRGRAQGGAAPEATQASASSEPVATPSSIATFDPTATATADATATTDATATATTPPVVKAAPAPGCNPPYETDARGVRRLKKHCLTSR